MNSNSVSEDNLAIHKYFRITSMKSVPLSCVEDPDFSHLAQFKYYTCRRIIKAVLSSYSSSWRTESSFRYNGRKVLSLLTVGQAPVCTMSDYMRLNLLM